MTAYVRALTVLEAVEMLVEGWTCARCSRPAVVRVVGPGAYRLCAEHGEMTRQGLVGLSVDTGSS